MNKVLATKLLLNLISSCLYVSIEFTFNETNPGLVIDLICIFLASIFGLLHAKNTPVWNKCKILTIIDNLSVILFEVIIIKRFFQQGWKPDELVFYFYGFLGGQFSNSQVLKDNPAYLKSKISIQQLCLIGVIIYSLAAKTQEFSIEIMIFIFVLAITTGLLDLVTEPIEPPPCQQSILHELSQQPSHNKTEIRGLKLVQGFIYNNNAGSPKAKKAVWDEFVDQQMDEWMCKLTYKRDGDEFDLTNCNQSLRYFIQINSMENSFLQQIRVHTIQQSSNLNQSDETLTLQEWIIFNAQNELMKNRPKTNTRINLLREQDEVSLVSPQNQLQEKLSGISDIKLDTYKKESMSQSGGQYADMLRGKNDNGKLTLQCYIQNKENDRLYYKLNVYQQQMETLSQKLHLNLFFIPCEKTQKLPQRQTIATQLTQQLQDKLGLLSKLIPKLGDWGKQMFALYKQQAIEIGIILLIQENIQGQYDELIINREIKAYHSVSFQDDNMQKSDHIIKTKLGQGDVKITSSVSQKQEVEEDNQNLQQQIHQLQETIQQMKHLLMTNKNQRIEFKEKLFINMLCHVNICFNYQDVLSSQGAQPKIDKFSLDDVIVNLRENMAYHHLVLKYQTQIRYDSVPQGYIITSDKRKIKQILLNLLMHFLNNVPKGFSKAYSIEIEIQQVRNEYFDITMRDNAQHITQESLSNQLQEGKIELYATNRVLNQLNSEKVVITNVAYCDGQQINFKLPVIYQEKNKIEGSSILDQLGELVISDSVKFMKQGR